MDASRRSEPLRTRDHELAEEALLELAQKIVRDPEAPISAVIPAAWMTIHGDSRPLRKLLARAAL